MGQELKIQECYEEFRIWPKVRFIDKAGILNTSHSFWRIPPTCSPANPTRSWTWISCHRSFWINHLYVLNEDQCSSNIGAIWWLQSQLALKCFERHGFVWTSWGKPPKSNGWSSFSHIFPMRAINWYQVGINSPIFRHAHKFFDAFKCQSCPVPRSWGHADDFPGHLAGRPWADVGSCSAIWKRENPGKHGTFRTKPMGFWGLSCHNGFVGKDTFFHGLFP